MGARRILAMGGGGFQMDLDDPQLDDYLLSLPGVARPRICLLPTASGDADRVIRRYFDRFLTAACEPTYLGLFARRVEDLRAFLLAQDLVYVSGGNTANMLAVWRAHGVDAILREAWSRGVVLAGLSAGSLCWFEDGVTDSFGRGLGPLGDGLGFVLGSHCPHYDGEARRRPTYTQLVQEGGLKPGHALDDGAALLFEGTAIVDAVRSIPSARAFLVEPGEREARETPIPLRDLPSNRIALPGVASDPARRRG